MRPPNIAAALPYGRFKTRYKMETQKMSSISPVLLSINPVMKPISVIGIKNIVRTNPEDISSPLFVGKFKLLVVTIKKSQIAHGIAGSRNFLKCDVVIANN
jgi:hypothetical protein